MVKTFFYFLLLLIFALLWSCTPGGLVFIEEITTDPQNITIKNGFGSSYDISGWYLENKLKTGKYIFPVGTILDSDETKSVESRDLSFEIKNNDEVIYLKSSNNVVMDIYIIEER